MVDVAQFDADVVVVGLGPVGMVIATLLANAGLRVTAIERDEFIHPLPRAAHIDHEVMRVFQQLGIAEAIGPSLRPAPPHEFRSASGAILMRMETDPDGSVSGWAESYMMHQPGIERASRAALTNTGADIRLGEAVTAVTSHADGVTVTLEQGRSLRARYLVACDGASSGIREALGVPLQDLRFDEPWLVVDALVDAPDLLPPVNLQLCASNRPTTCVHMPAGRHRWEFMLLPGERPDAMLDNAAIARLLTPWGMDGHVGIERKAVYRLHGLLAERWRVGRVLLAGDAAQQMPPFAGQGLCSGVRDAGNLAWKLAAVINFLADPVILDSYQTERGPHVRGYIEIAMEMGRIVCTLDPAVAAARDVAMLARRAEGGVRTREPAPQLGAGIFLAGSPGAAELFPQPWAGVEAHRARLDDVLGAGGWLIGRGEYRGLTPSMVRYHDLDGPGLVPFRAALTDWLDARFAAAVLVRPDRYVFGTGVPEALAEAFDRAIEATNDRAAAPGTETVEAGTRKPIAGMRNAR